MTSIHKQLVARDGDLCWLCGIQLRWKNKKGDIRWRSPLKTTLDHVVPRSKGGEDHLQNYRLAHRICNGLRGSQDVTVQLRRACRAAVVRVGFSPGGSMPAPQFIVVFNPSGRGKAQCPPNPDYPNGVALDASLGAVQTCTVPLTYPAPECGFYEVKCTLCSRIVGATAAGRPDDPISITMACAELTAKGAKQ